VTQFCATIGSPGLGAKTSLNPPSSAFHLGTSGLAPVEKMFVNDCNIDSRSKRDFDGDEYKSTLDGRSLTDGILKSYSCDNVEMSDRGELRSGSDEVKHDTSETKSRLKSWFQVDSSCDDADGDRRADESESVVVDEFRFEKGGCPP